MKKLVKVLVSTLCAALLIAPVALTACNSDTENPNPSGDGGITEHVDYAGQLTLDFTSETKKQEVTVKLFVDGDTTHFYPEKSSELPGCDNADDFTAAAEFPTPGYVKARYLAINTPESTAQIEEWGKAASKFTRSKLDNEGTQIIIESDTDKWDIDSTGERVLLWVWYKPAGATEFRNLNIEILQEGLAYNSNTVKTRYGEIGLKAIQQAEAEKLYVYSGEKDPDYYYGDAIPVDPRELRLNPAEYEGKKVVVEGTVTAQIESESTSYIEMVYDDVKGYPEGLRFGVAVYYGYTKGRVISILGEGNYIRAVGVFQFYETGGFYQLTDIQAYNIMDKSDPDNCEIIDEVGLENCFSVVSAADVATNQQSITVEYDVEKVDENGDLVVDENGDPVYETKKYENVTYCQVALGTSVTVEHLTVTSVSTTSSDNVDSNGAMTLTCQANGYTVKVRTNVFKKADGTLYTAADFNGKTITVKGIIELYYGGYQIKCPYVDYITIES